VFIFAIQISVIQSLSSPDLSIASVVKLIEETLQGIQLALADTFLPGGKLDQDWVNK
jgi:hypothetical protein